MQKSELVISSIHAKHHHHPFIMTDESTSKECEYEREALTSRREYVWLRSSVRTMRKYFNDGTFSFRHDSGISPKRGNNKISINPGELTKTEEK